VTGTYLHGAIENKEVLEELLGHTIAATHSNKDIQYDRLADWFAGHVDRDLLFRAYLERQP
jgi:cobyric acid synthase